MVSVELLRKQKLLHGLDESVLIDLGNAIRFEQFQKRDFVFHKGSAGDALVMLMSGRLQIIALSEDNREVGLSFLEPGDYCGELSIIDGLPRSASAIATTESMVGFLPKSLATSVFSITYSSGVISGVKLYKSARLVMLLPYWYNPQ